MTFDGVANPLLVDLGTDPFKVRVAKLSNTSNESWNQGLTHSYVVRFSHHAIEIRQGSSHHIKVKSVRLEDGFI